MRIVNFIFIFVSLLAAIVAIASLVPMFTSFLNGSYLSKQSFVIIFLFVAIVVGGVFIAWQNLKALWKGKNLFSGKGFYSAIGYSVAFLGFLIFLAITGIFFVTSNGSDPHPELFPLNNEKATYIVERKDNLYYIAFNGSFSLKAMVGKSQVDLLPLVGEQVNLNGEFNYGKKQCIVNQCTNINSRIVLDISSIQPKR